MSRNISEICLEIGKTVKYSGASPEACNKVDDLLFEIVEARKSEDNFYREQMRAAQVSLTKHEIKVLQTSLIKRILATIESKYDLSYGEMLLNPREFYDLVEEFHPTATSPTKFDLE